MNVKFILSTSNPVQRLFSTATYAYNDEKFFAIQPGNAAFFEDFGTKNGYHPYYNCVDIRFSGLFQICN